MRIDNQRPKPARDWRGPFLARFGPGLLGGITFGQWWNLLIESGFDIDLPFWPRAAAITMQSLKNSVWSIREERRFGSALRDVAVPPPLFVLGHWRSGTTHLHQILAQDRRFAFANTYQVSFPHIFLTTEQFDLPILQFFCPRYRPMDNVELSLSSPQEDEFALCVKTFKSPCMSWVFPRQRMKFECYLSFRGASVKEIEQWKSQFEWFVKKLTWKFQRPLILKSPPHTCRIWLLLELFPEAKFVHVHRDPYTVFQSSRTTFLKMFEWQGLQRPRLDELEDWILRQYREMYAVFFEEQSLIPKGRFHEVRFEKLEKDSVGEVRRVYESLDLPEFAIAEPDIRRYVGSLAGYRKNSFPELPPALKARIAAEWKECFERWSYPVQTTS